MNLRGIVLLKEFCVGLTAFFALVLSIATGSVAQASVNGLLGFDLTGTYEKCRFIDAHGVTSNFHIQSVPKTVWIRKIENGLGQLEFGILHSGGGVPMVDASGQYYSGPLFHKLDKSNSLNSYLQFYFPRRQFTPKAGQSENFARVAQVATNRQAILIVDYGGAAAKVNASARTNLSSVGANSSSKATRIIQHDRVRDGLLVTESLTAANKLVAQLRFRCEIR